ncbi:MAG: amidohydrolase family protein [Pseudonocardia sp.]|nr:amidohydrolase family protein [Pseudonocardia sp.]
MPRTLLTGLRAPGGPGTPATGTTALEITDGTITWLGPAADVAGRAGGASVEDHDGAVVTPPFVDAHVHATASGLLLQGLDLTACRTPGELLDAVAAAPRAAVLWGHGWEENRWSPARHPSRAELDRAARGRAVYLSRIDVHSALVSTALLDRAPAAVGAAGWSPDGPLSADAHHHVRRAALAALDGDRRRGAQRAFLDLAASRGVGTVHECAGPDVSGQDDLADLLAAEHGVAVVGYWGEAVRTPQEATDLLRRTGAHGLAGDLFVDGSIGSRTALLREPYADEDGCLGNRYLDPEAVAAHLVACTRAGIRAGFHVIGDAGADVVLAGLEQAVAETSARAVRAARHRLEHLEMVDAAQIARLAALGVAASVQPAFDAAWGGPAGMYATRLGPARAAVMNPFAQLSAAGVVLELGSDSPVTPVDPWAAVRAAVGHTNPASALDPDTALAAHTGGGRLRVGSPASYALWDGDTCLRLVRAGRTVHELRR